MQVSIDPEEARAIVPSDSENLHATRPPKSPVTSSKLSAARKRAAWLSPLDSRMALVASCRTLSPSFADASRAAWRRSSSRQKGLLLFPIGRGQLGSHHWIRGWRWLLLAELCPPPLLMLPGRRGGAPRPDKKAFCSFRSEEGSLALTTGFEDGAGCFLPNFVPLLC